MKKKIRKEYGITLVALVITIIMLLILAGISISALTNTEIFEKAQNAKQKSEEAEQKQSQTLGEYEKEINKYVAEELTDDKINVVLNNKENTVLKDAYGNVFTVPAGFKIVTNDDTNNAKTVDKGIVIEDVTSGATAGSQFVWVPIGTIKKEDGTTVEINLNRYTFDSEGKQTPQNENVIGTYYQELTSSDKGNTVAKNIADFKTSVATNGGYYIGRYEARTATARDNKENSLTQITEKGTDQVYNYVTQLQAAIQAQNMYNSTKFTSDLINSYAWDTAITFIQKCTNQTNYANQISLNAGSIVQTGTNNQSIKDVQCNVYDMASNIQEWTTETSDNSDNPCVGRGGDYSRSSIYTSFRGDSDISGSYHSVGFRPILYL